MSRRLVPGGTSDGSSRNVAVSFVYPAGGWKFPTLPMQGVNCAGHGSSDNDASPPGPAPKVICRTVGSLGSGPGGPVSLLIVPPDGGMVCVVVGSTVVVSVAESLPPTGSARSDDAVAESVTWVGSATSGAVTTTSTEAESFGPSDPRLQLTTPV